MYVVVGLGIGHPQLEWNIYIYIYMYIVMGLGMGHPQLIVIVSIVFDVHHVDALIDCVLA